MADNFVGEIRSVGFNFAPVGWALCQGQLIPISQNTALFSLLGTFYGGNGTSNFALPNLLDRVPIGYGDGAGLTPRSIGESGGEASTTVTVAEMPGHNHGLIGSSDPATGTTPAANLPAVTTRPTYAPNPTDKTVFLNSGTIAPAGGSQAHNNIQPTAVVNFVIALQGIFPARN